MIFIPGNVPSSKNSKVKTATGVFNSKTVTKYLQKIGVCKYSVSGKTVKDYKTRPNLFRESVGDYFDGIEYPAIIGFHFARKTRRIFDFHNACQIVADLLVAHNFIEDDSMDYFLPVPLSVGGKWYTYDKCNPGVGLHIFDGRSEYKTRPLKELRVR